ncbi:MAG: hypothetical protein ACRDJN_00310 [Chloroflexota bacterium]
MARPHVTPLAPSAPPASNQRPAIRGPADLAPQQRAAFDEAWRNMHWADEHNDELEAYAGHWLCIAEQRLVLAKTNRDQFQERLHAGTWRKQGQFVLYMPTLEELDTVHPPLHATLSTASDRA